MKWRNEYGEADTGGLFWGLVGAVLTLALLTLAAAAGSGIAAALAGVGA